MGLVHSNDDLHPVDTVTSHTISTSLSVPPGGMFLLHLNRQSFAYYW